LAQSIFAARAAFADMLTIPPRFAGVGLGERDDTDGFTVAREGDEEDAAFDLAKRVEPGFAILPPWIFPFQPRSFEQRRGGCERKPALALVSRALGRIELEPQRASPNM
jgi:hypothetical protein